MRCFHYQQLHDLLGLVKLDWAFSHFTVVVLLSVARVRGFCESSIGILKTTILSAYKDYKFAKDCKWLPEDLKEDYVQIAQVMDKAIIRAVNESNYRREHIIPSVVQFGVGLLEGVEDESNRGLAKADGLLGAEELGSQLLNSSFEVHEMARKEILEQCKFRILFLKPEQASPFLSEVVKSRLPGNVIYQFAPLDTPVSVEAFLGYWKPTALILLESKLWPNLIIDAAKNGDVVIIFIVRRGSDKLVFLRICIREEI